MAESLTGWTTRDASGQPLGTVFRIVNEETRQPVDNPALRALREGAVVGLANHTILVAKDGVERADRRQRRADQGRATARCPAACSSSATSPSGGKGSATKPRA